ncbi:DUF5133 domain-containing protein [Streptomyces sp. RFCAC02]|uniref:DUF5133 domain-containing protein n=1 Tax=Streptomyces sp. RFCAC02 TaxID=2499143 RepID=UPI001020A519|nr:DUF5133 domain-containing protein [Streptomyces sp. RFCAC02]
MLMAHPTVLRNLIDEYEALRILQADTGGPDVRQRMEDVAYTLCVSTGTRQVDDALAVARRQLEGTPAADTAVLSGS